MPARKKETRLHFDLPKKEGVGKAQLDVYEASGEFSLVVTTEHGGDVLIFMTRAELTKLQQKFAQI